jgi:hypothetical protein
VRPGAEQAPPVRQVNVENIDQLEQAFTRKVRTGVGPAVTA